MVARGWMTLAVAMASLVGACRGASERASGSAGKDAISPSGVGADAAAAAVPYRRFASPAEALRTILAESKPRVLGVGEFHQKLGSTARSALARFTDELFAVVAPRTSDVVLETWVLEGRCGQAREEAVSRQVQASTERPPGTEDELGALVTAVRAAGARPHVMTLHCSDYATLTPAGGEVDYEALLGLVTRELGRVTTSIVPRRDAELAATPSGTRDLVVVYGGALHNDRFPTPGIEAWSYAAAVDASATQRYVEVDLYVPEYVRGQKLVENEAWYGLLDSAAGPEVTLLIPRGERSWIVLLPTTSR